MSVKIQEVVSPEKYVAPITRMLNIRRTVRVNGLGYAHAQYTHNKNSYQVYRAL